MTRLSRRNLIKAAGLSAAGAAAVAAAPAGSRLARLADTGARAAADAPGVQLVRIGQVSGDARMRVVAGLDATHRVWPDGSHEFLLWPGDQARLDAAGIDYTVVDQDLLAGMKLTAARRVGPQPGQRDEGYRFWPDFEADMRALAEAHPTRARLLELNSPSLVGRTIFGIEIATDVARRDGRPVVHMDGMHHAREWPAAEMPIMWAFDLLENYGSDADITEIVDNVRTIIVPNNNPDGFIRSRNSVAQFDSSNDVAGAGQTSLGVTGQESYWRKNLRSHSGVNHSTGEMGGYEYDNLDAYGVDLNRNYAFLWGDNLGASGNRYEQTHYGSAPFSEPEVANIRDLFYEHAPVTAITHHTSGQIMLFAWGRDPDVVRSPDYDDMLFLGEDMQLFNGYTPKQAFGLYPTAGTSRDWGHYVTRTMIYTFEHGTQFHGPYDDTIPEMYEINRGAFITISQAAMNPATHVVITGRVVDAAGNPVPAKVRAHKAFETPSSPVETGSGLIDDDPLDVLRRDTLPEGDIILTPEEVDTHLFVEDDGTFTFHLPPSTRPHLFEEEFGGPDLREPWEIIVEGANGGTVTIPVTAERGEAANLGTITV